MIIIIIFMSNVFENDSTSQATEGPLHIARDCLGNRQRRIDYDLVQVFIIRIIVIDFKLLKKD